MKKIVTFWIILALISYSFIVFLNSIEFQEALNIFLSEEINNYDEILGIVFDNPYFFSVFYIFTFYLVLIFILFILTLIIKDKLYLKENNYQLVLSRSPPLIS